MGKVGSRTVIEALTKRGETPQTVGRRRAVRGDGGPGTARPRVPADGPRPGRPVEATSSDIVRKLKPWAGRCRWNKAQPAGVVAASPAAILNVLRQRARTSEVRAGWAPSTRTPLPKQQRVVFTAAADSAETTEMRVPAGPSLQVAWGSS